MVQVPERTFTLEAFLKLPETKPASKYIDEQVIQKPMPQGRHSKLRGNLVTAINQMTENRKLALAFPELRCTFAGRSLIPDVAMFAWNRIPVESSGDVANVFPIHPDWTIEILSPDQSPTKVIGNILHCLNQGCQMGWLIDPAERSVIVYPAGQQPVLLQAAQARLLVPKLVSDLQLTVSDVFGWLKLQ